MAKSFYIIDGSSYIYRAYYAVRNLSNSRGLPTNAIYGVVQMLIKILKEKPDGIVVAFDMKGPTFRHNLYTAYKAHRPSMPDDLSIQIPYIHRIVSALGIFTIAQEGVEADDLIGTLAKKGEAAGFHVTIVSGDKDLLQLLSPHIVMYDTLKEKIFTTEDIRTRFGVSPSQLIEIMGLMGDAVDNIPGVRGIGEKTAIELIGRFGTLEALLSNLDAVEKKSVREALHAGQESARLSRNLATIRCDCPISFNEDAFLVSPPNTDRLIPLLEELEFRTLLRDFQGKKELGTPSLRVDVSEFVEKIEQSRGGSLALILTGSKQLGLGYPFAEDDRFCLVEDSFPSRLKAVLNSDRFTKVAHDLKPVLIHLQEQGIPLSPPFFDTQIAAYLLDPSRGAYPLAETAQQYLNRTMSEGQDDQALSVLLMLAEPMQALLAEKRLLALLTDMELPLVAVLANMEKTGVKIDRTRMAEIAAALQGALLQKTEQIYALAGRTFNIHSPKQLGHILFDVLGLPPPKKTKTGYSTDEAVLTQLSPLHPLPEAVLAYRQEMKLKTACVDPLLERSRQGDGRVYTTFHQTVTATGRLSSSNPNLQNIPIRGEWGAHIRETFIVEEGCLLLAADYNQIELRILAHCSQDPGLIQAYQTGADLHRQTAMEIFGLPAEKITPDMRRVAKAVNFGIVYGISPFGLAAQLGIPQSAAKQYMELYFARYPGVTRFIEETIANLHRTGYVTTLFNRQRPIPESRNKRMQDAGERMAVNTRIQGSAADIIKAAMVNLSRWMQTHALQSRMILQVHDELLFEVPEAELPRMREGVIAHMQDAAALSVPLTVEIGVGHNWRTAKLKDDPIHEPDPVDMAH